ncbi:hypothetical protein [Nocardia harenae]|uniref:hypothetical protein n=1 Tax=Nocardia harenae TaxID=358707 RepID=UPI000831ADA6|nr:hypothetical protein [Nocardia harenae]
MMYLLALIAVVAVAVLCWKAFGPAGSSAPQRKRTVGPDDDPEFLWRLSRQQQHRDGEAGTGSAADR